MFQALCWEKAYKRTLLRSLRNQKGRTEKQREALNAVRPRREMPRGAEARGTRSFDESGRPQVCWTKA